MAHAMQRAKHQNIENIKNFTYKFVWAEIWISTAMFSCWDPDENSQTAPKVWNGSVFPTIRMVARWDGRKFFGMGMGWKFVTIPFEWGGNIYHPEPNFTGELPPHSAAYVYWILREIKYKLILTIVTKF